MRKVVFASLLLVASFAFSAPPPPPDPSTLALWETSFDPAAPGLLAADSLLDAPAGQHGGIVVRDGHFYSGDNRVRLWGMNFAFGANFPTHEQADAVANRLARFGINAVRLHHMDNQPFPNGIFADASLTTLSPEALDRLDYLIAAFKKRGIWSDINLHVSRNYASLHPETAGGKQTIDKRVDLFDPTLIESQKRYAHDLLTHVNAYTHNRYADEPAVALMEINNENSLFMWDAEKKLPSLPAPYDAELKHLWNQWLLDRYHSRDQLAKAWSTGSQPMGKQMLVDGNFSAAQSPWEIETHGDVSLHATTANGIATLKVEHTDGTDWHAQFTQSNLHVVADQFYTLRFTASADRPASIDVMLGEAHDPWDNLGLAETIELTPTAKDFSYTFAVTRSDEQARLCFVVGQRDATVRLSKPSLVPGGVAGLLASEDPQQNTVALGGRQHTGTNQRRSDWYEFLENTEQKFYQSMYDYLHHDLGVKCPVTGTIAFGLMPLKAQLGMDFIDAHAYWQHPSFPHREWDMADWQIPNEPMVDATKGNALYQLAAYRVAGKPFTVTEYNNAAPNEWQAECVPMIASYAAAQDWDAVFLFAYSHSDDYFQPIMRDFFNFEGNPLKMPLVPMGARIFLGNGIGALPAPIAAKLVQVDPTHGPNDASADASSLSKQAKISYLPPLAFRPTLQGVEPPTLQWTSAGPNTGTGRYTAIDSHGIVFVGFTGGGQPIDLGMMSIQSMSTPFATLILTAADGRSQLADADHLLLMTIARAQNTDMGWNESRTTVGTRWGREPELIEKVVGTIRLQGNWKHCHALDAAGKSTGDDLATVNGGVTTIQIGKEAAQAYVIER